MLDVNFKSVLIVELKSATRISQSHIAQIASYLKTLNLSKGLLINFPYPQASKPEFEIVEIKPQYLTDIFVDALLRSIAIERSKSK